MYKLFKNAPISNPYTKNTITNIGKETIGQTLYDIE